MKLKFSGNNLSVGLTDAAGDPIYSCQMKSLDVEIDVAKLIGSIDEVQQAIVEGLAKAATEPTPLEA